MSPMHLKFIPKKEKLSPPKSLTPSKKIKEPTLCAKKYFKLTSRFPLLANKYRLKNRRFNSKLTQNINKLETYKPTTKLNNNPLSA